MSFVDWQRDLLIDDNFGIGEVLIPLRIEKLSERLVPKLDDHVLLGLELFDETPKGAALLSLFPVGTEQIFLSFC